MSLAILFTGACTSQPKYTPPSSPPGWTLTFDEEFDGAAGAPPDPLKWLHDTGGTGWGDNQLQYYTDQLDNAQLDGAGHLAIIARRESSSLSCWYGSCGYTSAKLTTRKPQLSLFAQGYGHFEARIKIATGKGLWPAFWLVGEDITYAGSAKAGEVDVMEVLGDRPNQVEQHAHGPGLDVGGPTDLPAGQSVADWHTYAINWTPDRIDWQIDGRTTRSLTKAEANESRWVFDHPFYILINLAVGGDWPGNPDPATTFPATMLIDYIRVYNTPENGG